MFPGLCALLSIATFADAIAHASSKFTNVDATVLWDEAHEWGAGRWRTPAFFGQSYGSSLLGIPVAILHGLGTSYAFAAPIALAASTLVLWFALAMVALRRGHVVLATIACAVPAILSAYYTTYLSSVPFERVFALNGVGIALLLWPRRSLFAIAAGVALLVVGAAIDASSLLLVAPAGAWWLLERRPVRREWFAVGCGAAIGVAYGAFSFGFYRVHPDENLQGGLPLRPSWSDLSYSGGHLFGLFRMFAPELLRAWWLPVSVACVCVALMFATRRARAVVPACIFVGLLAYALATPRARSLPGFDFLPPARLLLFLPPALWFFAFVLSELRGPLSPRVVRWAVVAVTALAFASFGVRTWDGSHQSARFVTAATRSGIYRFSLVSAVEQQCDAVARAVRAKNADAVVLLGTGALVRNNTSAVACDALGSGRVLMIDAPDERRAWPLHAADTTTAHTIVIGPVSPGFCAAAVRRFAGCEPAGDFAAVHVSSERLTDVLALLDIPLRPYGNGCVLSISSLASSLLRCRTGTDARLAFPTRGATVDAGSDLFVALHDAVSVPRLEPGLSTSTDRALAGVLTRPNVSIRDAFATGPTTYAATLTIPAGAQTLSVLAQFALVDGKPALSLSTACAIAMRNGISCSSPLPFSGALWRDPVPVSARS